MLTEKLNLYFIKVSKYLQYFNLNIYHKSDKQHIISDTLSQLVSTISSEINIEKGKLNILFVKIYTEMLD